MTRRVATPGPWQPDLDHQGPDGRRWPRVITDHVVVAHVQDGASLGAGQSGRLNCRLLAAAPDLLAALEEVLAIVDSPRHLLPSRVTKRMRAAIAAAKGKTPKNGGAA